MRAVVQRVLSAEARVDGRITGGIGKGLLVYVGVENGDAQPDLDYIASKDNRASHLLRTTTER